MKAGLHKQILFILFSILELGFTPANPKQGWYRRDHDACIQWVLFERGHVVGLAMYSPGSPPETRLMAYPTQAGWKAFKSLHEAKRAVEHEVRRNKAKK